LQAKLVANAPTAGTYQVNGSSHITLTRSQVFIVTGSNTGIGKELSRLLYSKNAKVYTAARSSEKATRANDDIKRAVPNSSGQLIFLQLNLSDLTTIKTTAATFLSQEKKLHVLFNNAGVMTPPQGSKSAQDYELQLGVNNLGPFLLTKLLTPILVSTAQTEPPNTVRVVWTSSSSAEMMSPKPGGVELDNLDYHIDRSADFKYGVSKVGNYFHAVEFSRRYKESGIISVALNPGNLKSDLTRNSGLMIRILVPLLAYPPVCGAYTELFAGLSPAVTLDKTGHWSEQRKFQHPSWLCANMN
jgi:retinol dehydrogenase-12